MDHLWSAISLLTVLPTPAPKAAPGPPGRSIPYYPVIGVMIGALLAALSWALTSLNSAFEVQLLTSALILAAWAALTGALHLDGWADTCDGLLAVGSRERRLEIMKDPQLGGFGTTGLILLLLVKLAALQAIRTTEITAWALIASASLGRWSAAIAAGAYPSARPGGMGDYFRRGLGRRELALASAVALVATLPLGWLGLVPWSLASLALIVLCSLAQQRLGGLTGDTYGAVIELVETLSLVGLAIAIV